MSLPVHFDTPQHLPYNRTCLDDRFVLHSPDRDPGGAGDWLLMRGSELIVDLGASVPALPSGAAAPLELYGEPLYLGTWQGQPCRLARVDKASAPVAPLAARDLLAGDPQLPIELLSLGALARQILHWEGNSHYCSKCGVTMQRLPGEWGKECPHCCAHHFPHIHPCVIVIVRRPGEVLLTRKAGWPQGRYSLVAGFLEFSECLEEAVAREVLEETGVQISNIRYVGSQGWPFPSQLMTGFVADYVGGDVVVEEAELEDARWFSVDALPLLPPKRSIARYLIDTYARA